MKILVIPDIHGRTFWKTPNIDDYDKVIFLGDYLDPYTGETNTQDGVEVMITPESAIENFKEIIDFKKNNSDKVVLLLGNHDLPYYSKLYGRALSYWCRHDYKNHDKIEKLFLDNKDLFKLSTYETIEDKTYLFTHAGITNEFYHIIEKLKGNLYNLDEIFLNDKNIIGLAMVSYYRGGPYDTGSLVWADVREHLRNTPIKELTEVFQIFGHTYLRSSIIKDNFAMLDVGYTYYFIDENGIHNN